MDTQRPSAGFLLRTYARGIFPMVDPRTGALDYYSPDPRGVIPLDGFRVPKSLARVLARRPFELRCDSVFEQVIRGCAESRPDRLESWLDERLIEPYLELHRAGFAHSIEAFRGEVLVGGLYGVRIGAAFFGESMFSRAELGGTDASKICLVKLVETLLAGGFRLLDTQFSTPHLARFGCVEIPRDEYLRQLAAAIGRDAQWPARGA